MRRARRSPRPWLLLALASVVLTLAGGGASADDDPDSELARQHFERGSDLYAGSHYADALREFEWAKRLRPLPELDYNIARCQDRLEQMDAAVASYERFLAARPAAPETPSVRARVGELRARLAEHARQQPAAPRRVDPLIAPAVVGGLALALAATGAGLSLSVGPELQELDRAWSMQPTGALQARADALEARWIAGLSLLGAAGVAVLVDVPLWIVAVRRRDRALRREP